MLGAKRAASARTLRRAFQDLLGLSKLPEHWVSLGPQLIAESGAKNLLLVLDADLVHVSLGACNDAESRIESTCTRDGAPQGLPSGIRSWVRDLQGAPSSRGASAMTEPLESDGLQFVGARLAFDTGTVVAGSRRTEFPTDIQRVLLSAGANAISIAAARRPMPTDREGQRLGVLVERSADLVGVATMDGETRYVNPAGLRFVGLASLAAARTARVLDFIHEGDRNRVRDVVWPTVIRAGRWQGEVNFRHFATGAALPFLVDAFRIDDPQTGRPTNVATVSRDLSPVRESQMVLRRLNETLEQRVAARAAELAVMNKKLLGEIAERERGDRRLKELQNELFHVARLSVAGEMAGALAHELNQPLTASANYVNAARRLLATQVFDKDKVAANMTEGARQMVRAGQIIRRLRDFATDGESKRRVEPVATLVDEASSLALSGGDVDVDLVRRFDPEADAVLADRIQIQQVLVNLMRNSLEAMTAVQAPTLVVTTRRVDSDTIEIEVADNGPGLPAAVRERLFEPFVSSKPSGMGLGLSICRSIVEAHHGRISAGPNEHGGTTFRFTLAAARLDDAHV